MQLSGCRWSDPSTCPHALAVDALKASAAQAELDRVEFAKWSVALDRLSYRPTVEDYQTVIHSKYSTYLEDDAYRVHQIGYRLGDAQAYRIILDTYLIKPIDRCHVSIETTPAFNQDRYDPKQMIIYAAQHGNTEMQDLLQHLYQTGDLFEPKQIQHLIKTGQTSEIHPCVRYQLSAR